MIISASYKTDIPALYGDWFRARRAAGHATVRNVWNGKDFRVSLRDEDCSAFVFWTRNPAPFRDELDRTAQRHPFTVQFTVNGNPRWLERAVPARADAVEELNRISARFGPDAAVWRYDPVLLTDDTPASWHVDNFTRIADAVAGATNEVVVSFARIYRKTRRNLDRACAMHRHQWQGPPDSQRTDLAAALQDRAGERGITLSLCAQPDLIAAGKGEGITFTPARCIDVARLNRVAAHFGIADVTARTKGPREGCLCAESRDIGAYDTCSHGCVYCYAVSDPDAARRHQRAHRPDAESLHPETVSAP
ncbi:MAG: DUF1848 domain-containing protein [Alphaproteobacteria bacterium]|nr:DUF1848 domain-containing protein [Alphaproteobacteria bacterium]